MTQPTRALIAALVAMPSLFGCSHDAPAEAAASVSGNAPAPSTTADRDALSIPGDLPADQRGGQVMRQAMQEMARARGAMSTCVSLIESHGTPEFRQRFKPVKQQYEDALKQAQTLGYKMAAADADALPELIDKYNANWHKVTDAVDKAKQLQFKAIAANPTSSKQAAARHAGSTLRA